MNKQYALELLNTGNYYSNKDLQYNEKLGYRLSKSELAEFLDIKDQLVNEDLDIFKKLDLVSFNSKHIFYVETEYLKSLLEEYSGILDYDFKINQSTFLTRNMNEMVASKIFSEIEGTLVIENVNTTHKRISEVLKMNNPTEANDIIVKNMFEALKYIVYEKPEFNKENLYHVYNLLSANSLAEDSKLKEGQYYRYDSVYIGAFQGADASEIEECMDSLFEFANNPTNIQKYKLLLPYICQYYVLYIHPYFDFNGRTARMISFWLNYIYGIPGAPYFMSEAINEHKNKYYEALINTRVTNNDLTFFLGYILETAIKYSYVYKNLEEIKDRLYRQGDSLTSKEFIYLKKIVAHNCNESFTYKMFLEYINTNMSKSGALKILNRLYDYGVLTKKQNKKNESIFMVNPEWVTYKFSKRASDEV